MFLDTDAMHLVGKGQPGRTNGFEEVTPPVVDHLGWLRRLEGKAPGLSRGRKRHDPQLAKAGDPLQKFVTDAAHYLTRRDPCDPRPEGVQPFIDPLVPTFDLTGIVDGAGPLSAHGGEQHGHAGANVG